MRQSFTNHELSKIIQMGREGWELDSIFDSNGYTHIKMSKGNDLVRFEQTEQGMLMFEKVGRIN